MRELKIQIDEKLIQTFGYSIIEQQIQDFVSKLYLKIAAQEMLKDINNIDLENDEKWKVARELAWQQEGNKNYNNKNFFAEINEIRQMKTGKEKILTMGKATNIYDELTNIS